ncbi:MAG: GNAT family N-acetyltransferase [Thermomicrobiales bacterium]
MDEILPDLSTPTLTAAIEASAVAWFADGGRLPGGEVHDDPDLLWVVSGLPLALFNGVFRADLPTADLDAAIEDILDHFRTRHLPMQWQVWPRTRPVGLGECLVAHGLSHPFDLPSMAVDLRTLPADAPAPPGAEIEEVGDEVGLKAWAQTVAAGFEFDDITAASDALFAVYAGAGRDGWGAGRHRFFLARESGEPVAASALCLAEGVAGIGWVATVPAARGRGLGAALTVAPLHAARAVGYQVGVLQASPMGLPVYRRLGFREFGWAELYLWSP